MIFDLEKRKSTVFLENNQQIAFDFGKNVIQNLNYVSNKDISLSSYFYLTRIDIRGYTRADTKNISRIIPASALSKMQIELLGGDNFNLN